MDRNNSYKIKKSNCFNKTEDIYLDDLRCVLTKIVLTNKFWTKNILGFVVILFQEFLSKKYVWNIDCFPEITDSLLAAQAFVFFVAGFETSSTTISNALYELAQNQDIQDKLREEIKEHEKKNNGEWHYENIKTMPILDGVFKGVHLKLMEHICILKEDKFHFQ